MAADRGRRNTGARLAGSSPTPRGSLPPPPTGSPASAAACTGAANAARGCGSAFRPGQQGPRLPLPGRQPPHPGRRAAGHLLEHIVIARLSRPDAAELFTATPGEDLSAVYAERQVLAGRLEQLAAMYAAADITAAQIRRGTSDLQDNSPSLDTGSPPPRRTARWPPSPGKTTSLPDGRHWTCPNGAPCWTC